MADRVVVLGISPAAAGEVLKAVKEETERTQSEILKQVGDEITDQIQAITKEKKA